MVRRLSRFVSAARVLRFKVETVRVGVDFQRDARLLRGGEHGVHVEVGGFAVGDQRTNGLRAVVFLRVLNDNLLYGVK